MLFECFIGENPGWTNLGQITAKFVFKNAILVPSEVYVAPGRKSIQIFASRVVLVKPDTTVALYTSVHLVIDERAQILIAMCALLKLKSPVCVAGHHRHVLQMARSTFVAYSAIVGVIRHQPFDNVLAKLHRFLVLYRDPLIVRNWLHTRHDQPAFLIVFIFKYLYSTLTAGANRSQRRMPAEIWQIVAQRKASFKEILS